MGERADRRSFWTTLPGILSGVAGLLGATAAVLGILASLGWVGTQEKSENEPAEASLNTVRLLFETQTVGRVTRFKRLDVRFLPANSRIEARCDGPGCFDGVLERTLRAPEPVVSLTSVPLTLRKGARLEVRYVHPRAGSKIWTLVAARAGVPSFEIACAPPDEPPGPC